MTDARAISGEFADLKIVKTRSIVQIIIEAPIEEGESIVKLFGFPQPGNPVRLAVARLIDSSVAQLVEHRTLTAEVEGSTPSGAAKRQWDELSPTMQAGIRCATPAFWKFLREEGDSEVNSEAEAATYVRLICGVNTRAALATNKIAAGKWRKLDDQHIGWLNGAGA